MVGSIVAVGSGIGVWVGSGVLVGGTAVSVGASVGADVGSGAVVAWETAVDDSAVVHAPNAITIKIDNSKPKRFFHFIRILSKLLI